MNKLTRYPKEVRERAVRMVLEHTEEHGSQWATICSIAGKLGMTSETLRRWVRQAERDGGLRPGLTSDERSCMKEVERENRELRRANEILKSAAAFFGAELDRRTRMGGPVIKKSALESPLTIMDRVRICLSILSVRY